MNRTVEVAGTSAHGYNVPHGRQAFSTALVQGKRSSNKVCAKKGIHPKYYDEATVICNGEEVLTTSGTQPSYTVDVWSGNHPFYTKSESTLVSDEGRVSRFNKRFEGLSLGQVASSKGGDRKLEYQPAAKQKGKGKGKK